MITTEDYCSYEVAKLLKEKGFDNPCLSYFWSEGIDTSYTDIPFTQKNMYEGQILRPTHQMAMKWLRDVHELFIQIGYYKDWDEDADGKKLGSWYYWGIDIFYLPSGLRVDSEMITDQYDTYEDAVEAALKYCLTKLI